MLRSSLLVLAFICSTSTFAQARSLEIFMKVPWSLGIHLAEWVIKERQKTFYVEVTADGSSLEQARHSAFRIATERAVGVVILSETETANSRLKRDEIISYASGYVDEYKIVDQTERQGRIWIKAQVWIKHSAIANRLLAGSVEPGKIDGERHSAQLSSLKHQQLSGDSLLSTVLNDFPKRSFVTKAGKTNIEIQPDRSALLTVDYIVYWDYRYLEALSESLKNLKPKTPICGVHSTGHIIPVQAKKIMVRSKKDPTRWGFSNADCYHYDDPNFYNQVEQRLGKPLFLIGKFYSQDKAILKNACFDIDLSRMNAVGYNLIDFRGDEYWYGRVGIPVSEYSVKDYHSVEFEIVADPAICRSASR